MWSHEKQIFVPVFNLSAAFAVSWTDKRFWETRLKAQSKLLSFLFHVSFLLLFPHIYFCCGRHCAKGRFISCRGVWEAPRSIRKYLRTFFYDIQYVNSQHLEPVCTVTSNETKWRRTTIRLSESCRKLNVSSDVFLRPQRIVWFWSLPLGCESRGKAWHISL